TARGSAHLVPLTLTLVAMTTAVLVSRRTTRALTRGRDALDEAARAAALLALMVAMLVPLSRTDSGGIMRSLEWVAPQDADLVQGNAHVIAWQAMLGPLLLVLTTLCLTALTRRDWWGDQGARLHAWLHAPLRGMTTLLLGLPVAGVLGLL